MVCPTSDQPTDVTSDDPAKEGYLYRDELVATFLSVAVSQSQSNSPGRAAALVLGQFEGDPFDALGRQFRHKHSFREALDYVEPEDIPLADFDDLQPDSLLEEVFGVIISTSQSRLIERSAC